MRKRNNRKLAEKIFNDLNAKGAGLGDVSITFISKSLKEYDNFVEQPFEAFVQEFKKLLKQHYGLEIGDCTDEGYLKQCYDYNETAEEVVEQIASKRNLERIDRNSYGF